MSENDAATLTTLLPLVQHEFQLDATLLQRVLHGATGQCPDTDADIQALVVAVHYIIATVGMPLTNLETPFGRAPDRTGPPPATALLQTVAGGILLVLLARVQRWLSLVLVPYTDAAALLPTTRADQPNYIARLIQKGQLVGFDDPFKLNPRWGRRVRRAAVLALTTTLESDGTR